MAFFEKHLQAAEAGRQRDDAGVVGTLQQLPVRLLLLQAVEQAGDHHQARRHVDVEDVLPAPVLGEPAAERRADRRGEGRGDGEQRHALGSLTLRQLDQRQRESQRDQRAAGEALQRPEDDHAFKVPGEGAEQGRDQKTDRHPDGKPTCREQLHQPGGQRNHDDFRHQVGGGNPRAFLQRGRERALDVLERRVGDLDIQHRHEGAEHGAHHGDPVAPAGFADRAGQCISGHEGRPSLPPTCRGGCGP